MKEKKRQEECKKMMKKQEWRKKIEQIPEEPTKIRMRTHRI